MTEFESCRTERDTHYTCQNLFLGNLRSVLLLELIPQNPHTFKSACYATDTHWNESRKKKTHETIWRKPNGYQKHTGTKLPTVDPCLPLQKRKSLMLHRGQHPQNREKRVFGVEKPPVSTTSRKGRSESKIPIPYRATQGKWGFSTQSTLIWEDLGDDHPCARQQWIHNIKMEI